MNRNIRDREKFFSTHWDWTFINWAFPDTKIAVEDIDGHLEHKGYHLYIETKLPGVPIPYSQEVTHLTWQDAGDTVMVIWGENNEAVRVRVYYPSGLIQQGAAGNVDIAFLIRGWYLSVENKPAKNKFYTVPIPASKIDPIDRTLKKLHEFMEDISNGKTR